MKMSFRRVANTLLAVGVCAVAFAVVSGVLVHCGSSQNCLAASAIFGIPESSFNYQNDLASAMSTPSISDQMSSSPISAREFSGIFGVYLVTLAVLILIMLEFFELYYLKQLLHMRQRRRA